ncbi:MAG: hypothetical protein HN382_00075, partial [Gammaproteobacteria bacterium]|nr:hypothetical protein [Gammaproteobacteria bacterium]
MSKAELEKIEWNEALSVNHPLLDQQHQTLIGVINWMVDSINGGEDVSVLKQLDAFESLYFEHFHREELILIRINYPDATAHTETHRKYEKRVHELVQKAHQDISPKSPYRPTSPRPATQCGC